MRRVPEASRSSRRAHLLDIPRLSTFLSTFFSPTDIGLNHKGGKRVQWPP